MSKPTAFRYQLPADIGNVKDFVDICATETLKVHVQVVRNGGETNLHADNVDSMWFVLAGRAAFYDEDEQRYVLGTSEMIVLPSGTEYWFESLGDEPLEILHIIGLDPRVELGRTDITPIPGRVGVTPHRQAEKLEPETSGPGDRNRTSAS